MISLPSNFPRRVRIRGGEFGASARAMHRKAAFENVSSATIERKTMSTKTTFKRIALVAVAALGVGMLTALPSNAAYQPNLYVYTADGVIANTDTSTATGGAVAGPANTVKVKATGSTTQATLITVTGPTGSIITGQDASNATIATGGASATIAKNAGPLAAILTIATPLVGTITVSRFLETADGSGIYSTTASDTVTITVNATAVAATFKASTSTAVMGLGVTTPTTDDTVVVDKAAGTERANIKLTLQNSSGGAYTGTDVSATVTGPGLIVSNTSLTAALGTSKVATVTLSGGIAYITISGDGAAGTSSIAISVGGVLFSTKTVTFSGSAASYVVVPAYSMNTIPTGATTANALDVVAYDANGNIVAGKSLTMTSSNTAVVASGTVTSSSSATAGSISLTALAAVGKTTLTFSDATSTIAATATFTITVSSGTISTSVPSLSFDKATYAPGEKMVLKLSAVDASGLPVPNTVTAASLLTSAVLSSNTALQGFPTVFTGTLTDGSISYTVYAPLIAGDVTVIGTGANTAATALSATASVTGGDSAAAVDAANAATDAANYAADAADAATTAAQEATAAAQAAQDSADAATAAVVALGLRVNVLMASVRAQLTSLSNLLVRIIKKTHA